MRIPAAITAASLTFTPATPVEPVEQLLDDVSATHESSITSINSAETDDEVRDVLIAWRKELIAAADELTELREEAAEDGLTEEEKAAFDEATKTLKRERAGVRELRAELLPDDAPVVVPSPIEGLDGILGTTAFDAFERSEAGDAPIVYGIPGSDADRPEPTVVTSVTSVTKPTVVEEPTSTPSSTTTTSPSTTSATFDPEVTHRVERLQDSDTTTTETTTTETTSSSTSTTTGTATETETSATSTTTDASATTTTTSSTSSSSTRSVLENRTTSATSSSTTSSSSSTTSSSSKTSSTTTTEDDDERDGDLADTGTPMRALIAIGMLSLMIGAALVLTGAIRPRGARK